MNYRPVLCLASLFACAPDHGDDVIDSSEALAAGGVAFQVATLEPGHDVEAGIPIAASEGAAKPVVIYSVPLDGVGANETLHVQGQVSVSRCNRTDVPAGHGQGLGDLHSPCERHKSYNYAPHVKARLVLHDGGGPKVLDSMQYACSTELHHCPFMVKAHVNGVAVAHGSIDLEVLAFTGPGDTPTNDVVELEAECAGDDYNPCHPIPQNPADQQKPQFDTSGQLTLVRIAPGAAARTITTSKLEHDKIPITTSTDHPGGPTLLFSRELTNVQPGDVVEATATMLGKNDRANAPYRFDHFFGTWIFLTTTPNQTRPSGAGARWISPFDGKNCDTSVPGGACERVQAGALQVPADLPPGAKVYVNVAGWAIEKGPSSAGENGKILDVLQPSLTIQCTSAARANPCGS
jgi:hypothetical protein